MDGLAVKRRRDSHCMDGLPVKRRRDSHCLDGLAVGSLKRNPTDGKHY
jgi:hypothetical protein